MGENDYQQFRNEAYVGTGNLPSQLDTYDIIYINFKKGSDDLHRNAYLVEDIIKWINSVKVGTQPNVVLGQSMGGILARYALRDMENQYTSTGISTWQHQTNLYISHDAPHQGANIPLSLLAFARHMVDQFVSTPLGDFNINITGEGAPVTIEDMQGLLNATGTKQLLINNVNLNGSFSINNTVGDAWRTELRNLGYPLLTRNIAISNGSHCALTQPFAPSANLFTFTGSGKTSVLTDFILFYYGLNSASAITLAILFNEPALLLGILPGNSKFSLDFYGKALPLTGATNRIYHGNIAFTKTLFRLFGWTPRITVTLTNRDYDAPGIPSYDYYPGGAYSSFITSGTSTSDPDFTFLGSYGMQLTAEPSFNFIPTTSALDIGKGFVTLTETDYLKKYNAANPPIAPRNTPFANFTTSFNTNGTNEQHISFNVRNGNWLATELDTNPSNNDIFDCSFVCSDTLITGNETLCVTANYSVPASGTYYNWNITEGSHLVNMTGNGTSNITLTDSGYGSGYVTIQATYGDNYVRCSNVTLTKRIYIGVPQFNEIVYGTANTHQSLCLTPANNYTFSIPELNDCNKISVQFDGLTTSETNINSNWEWIATNSLIMLNGTKDSREICPMGTGQTGLSFRARNACGWSEWVELPFEITEPQLYERQSQSIYTVYPNPSKDIVNIELRTPENQPENEAIISGELFDILGISKSKIEINDNKATFSVNGLNKGIYILKIYINNEVESHQIGVE